MGPDVKHATAGQVIQTPVMYDTSGAVATGLTPANTDIKLFKWGASAEVSKNSGGATHVAGGRYKFTLDATDTDTLGALVIHVAPAGALAQTIYVNVINAIDYEDKFGSEVLPGKAVVSYGTCQATGNDETHIKLESGTDLGSDLEAMAIFAYSGTGAPFSVTVDDWDNTTKIATFSPAVTTAADSTTKYVVIAMPAASTSNPVPANIVWVDGQPIGTPDTAGYLKVTLKTGTGTGEVQLDTGSIYALANTGSTIPVAIWDALLNSHTTDSTMGNAMNALLSYLGTPSASNLAALVEAIKEKTDELQFSASGNVLSDTVAVSGEELAGAGTDGDPWKALGT